MEDTIRGAITLRLLASRTLKLSLAAALALAGCHHGDGRSSVREPSQVGVECGLLHDSPCLTASVDHVRVEMPDLTPPRTANNPEAAEIWQLSLNEAIAVALENAETIRTLVGGGVATGPGTFAGTSPLGPGTISTGPATIYDPAIAETQVAAALATFDTTWTTSVFWTRTDQPPGVVFGGGIPVPNERDQASINSSLTKPLATGGTAGIAFNSNYLLIPPFSTGTLSPGPDGIFNTLDDVFTPGLRRTPAQYTPNLEFTLRQPLLRGAGTDVNRAPIVITRLQSDQTLWDFKQAALSLVRSVEEAYWDLSAAHVALRSVEDVIPLAREVVRILEEGLKAGEAYEGEVAEAQTRFLEFQQNRVEAMNTLLARETVLRNLLGLPPSDGRRVVPKDLPPRAPLTVDWPATVTMALDNRPDVVRQRLSVRVRELQLLVANNGLKPQLDVEALWRINGLSRELDEAVGVLTDNQFTDWQLGVSLTVPLGFRQAAAQVQAAELRLQRDRAELRQVVHAASHQLNDIVRDLESQHRQYQIAEQRVQAADVWREKARIRFENPPVVVIGGQPVVVTKLEALRSYLQALSAWATAKTDAANNLARYNTTMVRLEEAKGTLLAHDNIHMHEDPCAQVRLKHRLAHPMHAPEAASREP